MEGRHETSIYRPILIINNRFKVFENLREHRIFSYVAVRNIITNNPQFLQLKLKVNSEEY